MSDQRPTRQYPCPHCGGRGDVILDNDFEGWPIWRRCGYCEGRGFYERPVLPRGAVRAFAVLDSERGWWGDEDAVRIVYGTKPSEAKMVAARSIHFTPNGRPMKDIITALRLRRAPEHDPVS